MAISCLLSTDVLSWCIGPTDGPMRKYLPDKLLKTTKTTLSILLVLLLFTHCSQSQDMKLLTMNELLNAEVYSSMEEALNSSEPVYSLSLARQGLKEVPKEILQLKNLQYLGLGDSDFGEFPEIVLELEYLQELNIPAAGIKSIPENIQKLKHLKGISLHNNDLSELPEGLFMLTSLTSLSLGENNLETIPAAIGNLKNLDNLDLSHNRLKELPEEIGQLENLRLLYVRGLSNPRQKTIKQLDVLPESLTQLKKLRVLDASATNITRLPKNLEAWELERIDISETSLTEDEVKRLKNAQPNAKIIAYDIE